MPSFCLFLPSERRKECVVKDCEMLVEWVQTIREVLSLSSSPGGREAFASLLERRETERRLPTIYAAYLSNLPTWVDDVIDDMRKENAFPLKANLPSKFPKLVRSGESGTCHREWMALVSRGEPLPKKVATRLRDDTEFLHTHLKRALLEAIDEDYSGAESSYSSYSTSSSEEEYSDMSDEEEESGEEGSGEEEGSDGEESGGSEVELVVETEDEESDEEPKTRKKPAPKRKKG